MIKMMFLLVLTLLTSCGWLNEDRYSGTSTTTTTNGFQARLVYEGDPVKANAWIRPNQYLAVDSSNIWYALQALSSDQGELNLDYQLEDDGDSLVVWIQDLGNTIGYKVTIPANEFIDLGTIELSPLIQVMGQFYNRQETAEDNRTHSSLFILGFPFQLELDSAGTFELPLPPGDYKLTHPIVENTFFDFQLNEELDSLELGLLSYDSESIWHFDEFWAQAESYWSFDDTLNGFVSDDLRGKNPGEIWNTIGLEPGIRNQGYRFTNTISGHLSFNGTAFHFADYTDFSFSLWIKIDTTAQDTLPILWKEAAGLSRYLIQVLEDGRLEFSLRQYIGIDKVAISQSSMRDGMWHHLVAQRRGNVMELWVDGILEGSEQDEQIRISPLDDGILNIGANRTNERRFEGIIDEMLLFRFALDSIQINRLKNQP